MAYDFSAKQLKVSKIIGSGSVGFNGGIMIYSASISTNNEGGVPAALPQEAGPAPAAQLALVPPVAQEAALAGRLKTMEKVVR